MRGEPIQGTVLRGIWRHGELYQGPKRGSMWALLLAVLNKCAASFGKVSWLHGFRTKDGEPLRGLSWRSGLHGEPLQGAGGIVALWCARREQVLTIPKGEVERLTLDYDGEDIDSPWQQESPKAKVPS